MTRIVFRCLGLKNEFFGHPLRFWFGSASFPFGFGWVSFRKVREVRFVSFWFGLVSFWFCFAKYNKPFITIALSHGTICFKYWTK